MAKGKIIGVMFGIIGLMASLWVISGNLDDVRDAEEHLGYVYGECLYDGFTEQQCLDFGGEANWPVINGKQAFEKYYGEGKTQFVYGEDPILGLGPLG
jgi:hypothetical protein